MNRFLLVTLPLLLLIMTTQAVLANDGADDNSGTPTISTEVTTTPESHADKDRLREQKLELHKENREDKKAMKAENKQLRKDLKETIEANREAMKEKFKTRREEFKKKVETIKDEKKKMNAENLDTKMSEINKKKTDEMTQAITRLKELLTKLTEKSATAKAAGQTTTDADSAIASANTAITAAETAIAAQAGKEYITTITTDTALKQNFGTTVSLLRTDLQATHKTVMAAKQAVMKAAEQVRKLKKENISLTPTISVTPTVTVTITSTPSPTP